MISYGYTKTGYVRHAFTDIEHGTVCMGRQIIIIDKPPRTNREWEFTCIACSGMVTRINDLERLTVHQAKTIPHHIQKSKTFGMASFKKKEIKKRVKQRA